MTAPIVPKLNLAPKRRKPLSLWNPLDYLQLLGWVFFFPQALRWYVETFGEECGLQECKTWAKRRQWWRQSPIQRSFWVQGLILTVVAPICLSTALNRLGIEVNMYGVARGLAVGVAVGVAIGVVRGIAFGVTFGVTFGLSSGVVFGIALGLIGDVAEGLSLGVAGGLVLGVAVSVMIGVAGGLPLGVVFGLPLGVTIGLAVGLPFSGGESVAFDLPFGVAFGVAGGVTFGVTVLRPELWLVAVLSRQLPNNRLRVFSRVTALPLPQLTSQILNWLNQDWTQAVHNLNSLLAYTEQFIPVVNAVNQSLARRDPDILLLSVSQLAEDPFDWNLIRYSSTSLSNKLKATFVEELIIIPPSLKRLLQSRFDTRLRTDTPARAAAAGFWYLHENQPRQAADAFSHVRHLPHGAEMQQLAQGLDLALSAEQLNDSSLSTGLSIPKFALLRAETWPTISRFRSVVDDAQIIYQSYSRSARSLALNRALGTLTETIKTAHRIPLAERQLIMDIAYSWQKMLLDIATDVGEIIHNQPVANPYVAGDPVEGSLFVGRGEVIKQLEELWLGNQLQSVVLYGHRRMGKTSILKNTSEYLGNIQVAYVNLLNLGAVSRDTGEGEVLIAISDAISHTLSISPPKDEDLLALPSVTFRRFIQSISRRFKRGQGLIIALDEFEKIEELIAADILGKDFLGFLRGILQEEANIAFAFAGLHTLEEMTEDYFNPLFASVLPIRVGFFSIGETRQLLANPDEDFTIDYLPDTLNEIYRLTAGQPYLTQLLGFQLVRHYNHQMFDQGRSRDPIFTLEDL